MRIRLPVTSYSDHLRLAACFKLYGRTNGNYFSLIDYFSYYCSLGKVHHFRKPSTFLVKTAPCVFITKVVMPIAVDAGFLTEFRANLLNPQLLLADPVKKLGVT